MNNPVFVMEPLKSFWNTLVSGIGETGRMSMLTFSAFREIFKPPYELTPLIRQLHHIGVKSLTVVLITGTVAGFVAAVQAFYQLKNLSAQGMMGGFVAVMVIKELAPMLTAFVMAARVGTGIAAEIGTMKVTEQIDALRAMATSPVKYLVAPRLMACMIMLPILIVFSDIAGILGGFIISVYFGMSGTFFLQQLEKFMFVSDVIGGLIKGLVFGAIVAMVGCYRGLYASGGAEGVGRTTAASAVHSFVLVIIADFLLNYGIYTFLDVVS